MKSRTVVTRSGRGFRGYFPSRKLNRMVEYESLLERDAIYLFEVSPGIVSYQEQPELVLYEHACMTRKYYPDFEVTLSSGRVFHIEVKPKNKFKNAELVAKYKSIQQRYQNHHAEFLILTDEVIRQEPLLSNLKSIARYTGIDADISQTIKNVEALIKTDTSYTLNDIVSMFGYQNALMMLARQKICCDYHLDLISPDNCIRLPQEADHDTVYF